MITATTMCTCSQKARNKVIKCNHRSQFIPFDVPALLIALTVKRTRSASDPEPCLLRRQLRQPVLRAPQNC